jgi:Methylamine utilisation protein MauE
VLSAGTLALVARLTLASAFALSAGTKLARRAAFTGSLAEFGVPAPGLVAWFLPPVEGGLAVALVVLPHQAWPAFASIAVLALFTGAVVANLAGGRETPCPCFAASGGRPVSAATVVRNGLLLAFAVLATGPVNGASAGPALVLTAVSVPATLTALRRFG